MREYLTDTSGVRGRPLGLRGSLHPESLYLWPHPAGGTVVARIGSAAPPGVVECASRSVTELAAGTVSDSVRLPHSRVLRIPTSVSADPLSLSELVSAAEAGAFTLTDYERVNVPAGAHWVSDVWFGTIESIHHQAEALRAAGVTARQSGPPPAVAALACPDPGPWLYWAEACLDAARSLTLTVLAGQPHPQGGWLHDLAAACGLQPASAAEYARQVLGSFTLSA